MSSALALSLLSSVRFASSPAPRAGVVRPAAATFAKLARATPAPPSDAPPSGVVRRLSPPVPLAPSVAELHAAGEPKPANAVHPDEPGAALGALEAELVAMLPSLERRAYRWCRDSAEAQDLAQDTLLRALGSKPTFDSRSHLRAWLYTVLRNLFISSRRREQSRHRAESELSLAPQHAPEASVPFLTRSVERALAGLPEAFARVVRLVDLEDYSYADAASTLGVPVGTVMSRLFRARKRLARDLPAVV